MCDNCKFVEPTPAEDKRGFVVNPANPLQKMPTESTIRRIMEELNTLAKDHKLDRCEDYENCELCYMVANLTHNDAFLKMVAETMKQTLGPFSFMIQPADFISAAGMFMLMGMRSQNFINQTEELKALEDLHGKSAD